MAKECLWIVAITVLVLGGETGSRNRVFADDCPPLSPQAVSLPQDKFLAYLTDSCRYDKNVPPDSNAPLNVTVKVDVNHLEAAQSQFTAYLTVQFLYKDQKLNYENLSATRSVIFGEDDVKEKIWTPRIQLKNQDDTTVIDITEEDVLVSIDKSGLVTYTYKMMAKFYCWMNLKKFPFDTQRCTLSFSDWSYNTTQLKLRWNTLSLSTFANNLHFTEFVIDEIEYRDGDNDGPYEISALSSSVGDFSELVITFRFHRDIGYYLLDFFIPSYLLVCTAWVTFWLQADAGPPRATLGASTVVAFITLHLGLSKDIPKVSYIKASDIWFLGISCFIFFSLAEFAFVNVIWRRKKIIELKKPKPKYIFKSAVMPSKAREDLRRYESQLSVIVPPNDLDSVKSQNGALNGYYNSISSSQETLAIGNTVISVEEEEAQQFGWTTMTPQEVAIYIDRKSRIMFPILFLIFNILYWVFVYYG